MLRFLFLFLGMSTRVLDRLAAGDFLESAGRDYLAERLLQAIEDKMILGYGLGGDMVLVNSYSHNLVIELCISFGAIVGGLLLLVVIFLLIKGWLGAKEKNEKILLLALMCTGFLKLFISSSFMLEGMLFLLLGVSIRLMRKRAESRALLLRREIIYEDL